jgi:hypothetical protein
VPSTLLAIRQALIRALNDGSIHTANSGTAQTVVIQALINDHPDASPDRYDGYHVYDTTSPRWLQQRMVKTGGFDPSTGTLSVIPPYNGTPQLGDQIEITQLFPSYRDVAKGDTSYLDLIVRGLSRILIRDRIDLSVTGRTASLSGYPWLDREERLLDVLEPGPVAGALPVSAMWRGVRLRLDAETPLLEVPAPLASTQTLTLVVLRPADTRVAVGGSWADSTDGPSRDTDEVVPPVNDVMAATLVEIYFDLMNRNPGRPAGNWAQLYALAWERAQGMNQGKRFKYYDPAGLPEPAAEAA